MTQPEQGSSEEQAGDMPRGEASGPTVGSPGARRDEAALRVDFDPDVERLHRQLYREPRDPLEGREPAPWWLWATVALALFWGGWYLGRHGGTFSTATQLEFPFNERAVAGQAAPSPPPITDPIAAGQNIYTQRCQACHQANGLGQPNLFPPIIGSEWVTGPEETTIRILLNGMQGPVEVAGATYNGVMPPWRDQLSDQEIAAVITFIRQWEGNDAEPVTPEAVAALRPEGVSRGTPWTAEELRALEGAAQLLRLRSAGMLAYGSQD
jgi:mono/diheme cytochrome c family protein